MNMQIQESTINFIKQFEILYLFPTQKENNPEGVITLGWNMKAYPNGTQVTMKDDPITQGQADQYLQEHLENHLKNIAPWVPVELNQNQTDALLCLIYDIGVTKYSRTFLAQSILRGESGENIRNAWAKIYKDSARRQAEMNLYFGSAL